MHPLGHRAVALGLLGLLAGLSACRSSGEGAASASQPAREAAAPVHVQTALAAQRPMPEYLTLTGTLRASTASDIAADANGKVVATYVERGQPVQRGQVIAIIDSRGAAFAATAAAAQARMAQSQLEQAQRDCDRVKHLLDTGAISQAEFDRQTAACTSQQWSAAAAEAQQASASKLVGDANIRAPFDGIIGERFVNVGQYVQPSTRVASVYNPDPLRLELTVPEANVAAIKQGTDVAFTVTAYGDAAFTGSVKFISPNVRESTRDMVVEAVVPNGDGRLKPGMFSVARVTLGDRVVPVVPQAALVRDESNARVFVVFDKQIQERLVQVGAVVGDVVAVTSGLKAGESVVLQPAPDVRDGARVD
jgi:membrane fusion protein, multidrug efflux system